MRHIIPISGKDSACTAIVQIARSPDLPYELIFNDTFAELPETESWLARAEQYFQLPIHRIGANLTDIIYEQGILPARHSRYCTRMAKIHPMDKWLRKNPDEATIYFGIRSDEKRVGYSPTLKDMRVTAVYPLQELHIDLDTVYAILTPRNLLPPAFFWNSIYELVYQELGLFAEQLLDSVTEEVKRRAFAWRSRTNCYFCFFQSTWEWVGLLEHHPDLFEKAERIERDVGSDSFSFCEDFPLPRIRRERAVIKMRRVRKLARSLNAAADNPNLLDLATCGLFCGK